MLLLYETAGGFALFKVLKEKKVEEAQVCRKQRGTCSSTVSFRMACATHQPVLCRANLALNCTFYYRTCGRILNHWRMHKRCVQGGTADQPARVLAAVGLHDRRICPTQVVKLKAFSKFDNTTEALAAATALVDSKLSKGCLRG